MDMNNVICSDQLPQNLSGKRVDPPGMNERMGRTNCYLHMNRWSLRDRSHRPLMAPSVNISGCNNSVNNDGQTSISQHNPPTALRLEPDINVDTIGA